MYWFEVMLVVVLVVISVICFFLLCFMIFEKLWVYDLLMLIFGFLGFRDNLVLRVKVVCKVLMKGLIFVS